MAKRSYVIIIASQKGGVGKTTVAVNLGTALKYQKYDVLLIDTDIATYSVNEHLGLNTAEDGYQKVINGEAEVKDVVTSYEPLGLKLILGGNDEEEAPPSADKLNRFYTQVMKLGYDFVIIDCPPGLFNEELIRFVNDVVILTTPDATSAKSSSKLIRYCDRHRLDHKLVINRSGFSKYDIETEEIEKLSGEVAAAVLPEDRVVQESNTKHKPAYMVDRWSSFSMAVDELARVYVLKVGKPEQSQPESERKDKKSFFQSFGNWSTGR